MRSLVIAPHPDDEILGVGGTLLRRQFEGATTGWLIVTSISEASGWNSVTVQKRKDEIAEVSDLLGFEKVFELNFQPTKLDVIEMNTLVSRISEVIQDFQPDEVFIPHPSDIHSDHRITFEAASAALKWFRSPSVKRVLCFETLSETNFGLEGVAVFKPNAYIDITAFLGKKLSAASIYGSEFHPHPFPRSIESLEFLSKLRGSESGFIAAEAFQLLIDRN